MSKYEKFTKEELVALAEKQESELASKKYGLVWDSEREPEQVVLDCENNLPILKRVKGKEIKTKNDLSEDNILIEGDNYHALTVLNYTHKDKIDVIYIDPPYNTGNKDFKYNDRFVDKEDGFRHSKWLNFMEKRLNLAKELLKKTGVIFISIDDNEQAQLKLLCDEIFGEENFLGDFIWQKQGNDNKSIFSGVKTFRNDHEYILVYGRSSSLVEFYRPEEVAEFKNDYGNADEDPRGNWMSAELGKSDARSLPHGKNYYTLTSPVGTKWTRQWHYSEKEMEILIKDNRVYFGKDKTSVPRLKKFLDEKTSKVPSSLLIKHGSTKTGQAELDEIFGERLFLYPKSTVLIEYLIRLHSDKDATVLDFMAGSGTTGHAVLELNKEDGGNRRFILCTNNENNICEDVTYPRLEKVIKGYNKNGDGEKVEGLGGNLQYFKTGFVKDSKNKIQVRVDLTQKCTEMLCVKENIFDLLKEGDDYKIFTSNKGNEFLCIYYNYIEDSFENFLKEIKKLKGKKIIYMFSMNGEIDRGLFGGIDNFVIEAIPQKILDLYKKLVKMNIPVKADIIFLELEKANKKIFDEKDKDDGARSLRVVLEKTIQKIAQKNNVSIFKENQKEEKIAILNDKMYENKIFNKVQWEENKTCLAIGNNASHGDYNDYDLNQVENFYRHIQSLLNDFGI